MLNNKVKISFYLVFKINFIDNNINILVYLGEHDAGILYFKNYSSRKNTNSSCRCKNKIIHIAVEDQSAYQIFAENGSLLHEPANKQSDDDLWVYLGRKADGAPDLILDNYFQHHPVTDFNYLNQSYFTFATASETEAFIPPTLPSTISPLSATTAINNLSPMT